MASTASFDLQSLPLEQLYQLVYQKEEAMKDLFGEKLCQTLGPQTIEKIPQVAAEKLSLDNSYKYHEGVPTPDQMGSSNLLRGSDAANRPFIAIKCDILDENKKKITEVVELIFKRYSIDGDGKRGSLHENNIVSHSANMGSDKENYLSLFYLGGGISFKVLKELMDGKVIKHPFYSKHTYYVQISKA